jgi:hypothetical protein
LRKSGKPHGKYRHVVDDAVVRETGGSASDAAGQVFDGSSPIFDSDVDETFHFKQVTVGPRFGDAVGDRYQH